MANTITNKTLITGEKATVIYFNLVCVSNTQETNTVVYNATTVCTALGIPLYTTPKILEVEYTTNSAAGVVNLLWDATTPVEAVALPIERPLRLKFYKQGGLPDEGGTGVTGNITVTTTGLATGDSFTLNLIVRPR